MNELQHWVDGAAGWLKGLGLVVTGVLFTELRYRRQKSKTRLGEAEDSGARWHLRRQQQYTESIAHERDAMAAEVKAVREELAAARVRGATRDAQMRAVKAHVLLVTRLLSERHPETARTLGGSEFMALLDEPPHP